MSDNHELAIKDLSLSLEYKKDSLSYGIRGLSYAALKEYSQAKSDIDQALAQPYLLAPDFIAELEATLKEVTSELVAAAAADG